VDVTAVVVVAVLTLAPCVVVVDRATV